MSNSYWPEDDENTMYLTGYKTLADLNELARKKWPEEALCNIEVRTDHIQTKCLGYDLYDSSDYTNFVILERV